MTTSVYKNRPLSLIWAHTRAPILTITIALILIFHDFWRTPAGQTQTSLAQENTRKPREDPRNLGLFENITISPRFSPDPIIIRGISGGSIPAARIAGRDQSITGPCVGLVDEEPDHRLELTAFFNYLSLQVESSQDTTLVIRGPGGSWCNDDFEGNKNPGIAGQWQKGIYEVWIGSYSSEQYHPYTIRITGAPLLNPAPFGR